MSFINIQKIKNNDILIFNSENVSPYIEKINFSYENEIKFNKKSNLDFGEIYASSNYYR